MTLSVKMMKSMCLYLAPIGALLLFTGCSTADYSFPEAAATNSPSVGSTSSRVSDASANPVDGAQAGSSDRLVAGNKVTITFSGNPSPPPKHEEKIREDGYLSPPLLTKPVLAAGKTVGKLQEELQTLYVPDYFKSLTVTVSTEERFVYVGGEVKSPGPRPYLPGMTVLKAIQAAGDFTEYGSRRNVTITRSNGRQETVNCSKALNDPKYDKLVYPDDRIVVKKRLW